MNTRQLVLWLIVLGLVTACQLGSVEPSPPAGLVIQVAKNRVGFAPQRLTSSAGIVSLIFRNTSLDDSHNLVLIREGADQVETVLAAGHRYGLPDYVDPNDPNVVMYTSRLSPGESYEMIAEVELGTYTYICTIPGHYEQGMHGRLTLIAPRSP